MNITFTGRLLLLPELVYLSVYLFKTCVYGINNGISCGVPVGAVYSLIYAVAEESRIIGGKSAVDITDRIFGSKSVDFVLHLNHFIGPAIIVLMLFIAYLDSAFIVVGSDNTLHEPCNTLGVLSALTEVVAVDLSIVIILVSLLVTGNGDKENILRRAECFCPYLGVGLYLVKSADVEQLFALTHEVYLRIIGEKGFVKDKTVAVKVVLEGHCSFKRGVHKVALDLAVFQ